ncbi:MAG TPA: uracil-DNA glycosylase [Spirochaetia bacterium]|nr:uracil-DNA glycosylase [Spirochaetia bacterium]
MSDDSIALQLFRLLDDVEDYLQGGVRTVHVPPTGIRRPVQLDQQPAELDAQDRSPTVDPPAAISSQPSSSTGEALSPARSPDFSGYDQFDLPERKRRVAALQVRIAACTLCRLGETRRNTVPGIGVLDPLVMVIGEGPGADEDASGIPFVGPAGQYLDKWLEAVDLSRHKNVYIANIVKCRPPNNRDPQPDESQACSPYLLEQIALIRPKAILSVGRVASQILTGRLSTIGSLRGRVYEFHGIPLIPTYHPSGVLRNPDYRRPVWEDMKLLRSILSR